MLTVPKTPPYLSSFFWKLLSITCFALISVLVSWMYKQSTSLLPIHFVFAQWGLPGSIFLLAALIKAPKKIHCTLFTQRPFWATGRSIFCILAFTSWFVCLQSYPLTMAIIFRIFPPWITFVMGILFFREKPSRTRTITGIVMMALYSIFLVRHILPPFWENLSAPHFWLLAFLFSCSSAGATTAGKKLVHAVPQKKALISLFALNTVFLFPFSVGIFSAITLNEAPYLIFLGVLELLGQWSLLRALKKSQLTFLAPLALWRILIHSFFGIFLMQESISLPLLLGACAGTLIMTFFCTKKVQKGLKSTS